MCPPNFFQSRFGIRSENVAEEATEMSDTSCFETEMNKPVTWIPESPETSTMVISGSTVYPSYNAK